MDIQYDVTGAEDNFGNLKDIMAQLAEALEKATNATEDLASKLQDAKSGAKDVKDNVEDTATAENSVSRAVERATNKRKRQLAVQQAGLQIAGAMVKQMMAADQETTNLGRSLNLSKNQAIALKQQFAKASFEVKDITVNSVRLAKANIALNAQLGTAFVFSTRTLDTFTKLTEIVGLSAEAASSLAFQAQRSGKEFREVEKDVLGASFGLQQGAGVALDLKGVLEATGKVTGQVRANLGANPEAIGKAVTAAKLFGAEIDDIVESSKSLLNFESSIENELKAELITGKQLNLERARALALAGDQEGLANELATQAGNFSEFSKLNVLQQNELAAAFGMSSDKLADILFKQETQNMNAKQLRALGKGELADRLEQLSTQDKINLAQEKFQTILGDISTVALPIVTSFGRLVEFLSESKVAVVALTSVMAGLAAVSVANAIATIYTSLGAIPFIGIGLAAAATVAFLAALDSGTSAVGLKEGGIVKPQPGGTLATIGEGGESEMVLPLSKANEMGFSNQNQQPIKIEIDNRWDTFKAAGQGALDRTQNLQPSSTFV